MKKKSKIAVIGGGSWATAIVKMLCENLDQVGWYMRNVDAIKHIKKEQHNPNYLSAVEFNTNNIQLNWYVNGVLQEDLVNQTEVTFTKPENGGVMEYSYKATDTLNFMTAPDDILLDSDNYEGFFNTLGNDYARNALPTTEPRTRATSRYSCVLFTQASVIQASVA